MPLTKQQIAIICHYRAKGRKSGKPPRDRLVLDGKVKLTPRRREILYHVAFTDDVKWVVERDWGNRWANGFTFVPYLGITNIHSLVTYLLRMKLVRFSPEAPRKQDAVWRKDDDRRPILLITPRGMDALLECVGGLH